MLDLGDILVSFDVVSLYTKILINEAIDVINHITNPHMTKLVGICLNSTFFIFQGEFYEQTCGVTMGFPLFLVVANLFMEEFETKALSSARFCPKLQKRCVDDTCVIWPYGSEKLNLFILHLNSQYDSMEFTMGVEVDGNLRLIDVLLSRMDDGSLSHQVIHKRTHIEQYLHSSSHHFLAQISIVLNTLATQTLRILDDEQLEDEKTNLLIFFLKNDYREHQGLRAFERASKGPRIKNIIDDWTTNGQLSFIHGTTDKIAHIVKKNKVYANFNSLHIIRSSLS